jgi:hypothetical protein
MRMRFPTVDFAFSFHCVEEFGTKSIAFRATYLIITASRFPHPAVCLSWMYEPSEIVE